MDKFLNTPFLKRQWHLKVQVYIKKKILEKYVLKTCCTVIFLKENEKASFFGWQ